MGPGSLPAGGACRPSRMVYPKNLKIKPSPGSRHASSFRLSIGCKKLLKNKKQNLPSPNPGPACSSRLPGCGHVGGIK
jgi:hypothetical protein